MKLSQLKYFIGVIDCGSINLAAKNLNVSQPTITSAIKELENELGVELFTRNKQRLIPTDAGMYFYSKVLPAIKEIEDAAKGAYLRRKRTNIVSIGIPPMIGSFVIPKLTMEFNKSMPDIKLEIVERDADTLKNMMMDHLLDFAIILDSARKEIPCGYKVIITSKYYVYVSRNHPLSQKNILYFDDFKDEKFIVFDRILIKNKDIAPRFKEYGKQPNIVMFTSQLTTIKNYVRSNLAITMLLQECFHDDPDVKEIETEFNITAPISLVWNVNSAFSPLQDKTYKLITKLFADKR